MTDTIKCEANEDMDLVKWFQTLENKLQRTQRHFNEFQFSSDYNTELKENTFSDITFDRINI